MKTITTNNTITVMECRYCDGTRSHRPYGMDDVAVCVSCGAEWDPVAVQHAREEFEPTCSKTGMPESICYCVLCEEDYV